MVGLWIMLSLISVLLSAQLLTIACFTNTAERFTAENVVNVSDGQRQQVTSDVDLPRSITSDESQPPLDCPPQSHRHHNPHPPCQETAEAFLRTTVKDWQRNLPTADHETVCRESEAIKTCFKEDTSSAAAVVSRCPAALSTTKEEQRRSEWTIIAETLQCDVCPRAAATDSETSTTAACPVHVSCIRNELSSLFWKICDEKYKFDAKQETQDICMFYAENVRCKQELVTSSCGRQAGQFLQLVLKYANRKTLRRNNCTEEQIQQIHEYSFTGFRYSAKCTSGLMSQFTTCRTSHIDTRSKLLFHSQNALVAAGQVKQIAHACRGYSQYDNCMWNVTESCPEFAETVYGFDGPLRSYFDKLQIICNEAKDIYRESLTCYQQVLRDRTLSPCNLIWKNVQPLLEDLSAYQFYCQQSSEATTRLTRELERLRLCYSTVFSESCGSPAANVMSTMIKRAFDDPFYLRYDFKPDCGLHERNWAATSTTSLAHRPPQRHSRPSGSSRHGTLSESRASSAPTSKPIVGRSGSVVREASPMNAADDRNSRDNLRTDADNDRDFSDSLALNDAVDDARASKAHTWRLSCYNWLVFLVVFVTVTLKRSFMLDHVTGLDRVTACRESR